MPNYMTASLRTLGRGGAKNSDSNVSDIVKNQKPLGEISMYFAENSSISAYACTNRVNFSSSDKANGSSSNKLVDPNNVVSFKKVWQL